MGKIARLKESIDAATIAAAKKRDYHYSWISFDYEEDQDKKLEEFFGEHCRYLAWGNEVCPTTKAKHRQGHMWLKNTSTITALQKRNKKTGLTMQIRPINKSAMANITYCQKDGDHVVYGEPPAQGKRGDLEEFMAVTKANPKKRKIEVLEEFSTLYCRYPKFVNEYRNLVSKECRQDYNLTHDNDHWPNEWICGPPGCTKSRPFQEMKPAVYTKAQNKWWGSYDHEEVVLIEDFDMVVLGSLLKIWADRYSFIAEIKGCELWIRPKRIIVTSNYTIEELFHQDPKLVAALTRRFVVRDLF